MTPKYAPDRETFNLVLQNILRHAFDPLLSGDIWLLIGVITVFICIGISFRVGRSVWRFRTVYWLLLKRFFMANKTVDQQRLTAPRPTTND